MMLVEMIRSAQTRDAVVEDALAFTRRLKLPLALSQFAWNSSSTAC